jgi:hypothetical protein
LFNGQDGETAVVTTPQTAVMETASELPVGVGDAPNVVETTQEAMVTAQTPDPEGPEARAADQVCSALAFNCSQTDDCGNDAVHYHVRAPFLQAMKCTFSLLPDQIQVVVCGLFCTDCG